MRQGPAGGTTKSLSTPCQILCGELWPCDRMPVSAGLHHTPQPDPRTQQQVARCCSCIQGEGGCTVVSDQVMLSPKQRSLDSFQLCGRASCPETFHLSSGTVEYDEPRAQQALRKRLTW